LEGLRWQGCCNFPPITTPQHPTTTAASAGGGAMNSSATKLHPLLPCSSLHGGSGHGSGASAQHRHRYGALKPQMRCNCRRSWIRGVHARSSPCEAIRHPPSVLRYVGMVAPACPSPPSLLFRLCLQVIPDLACLLPCRLFGLRSFVLLIPPAHTHSFRSPAQHSRHPPLTQHFRSSYLQPPCCSNRSPSRLLP
jgi:hypothetical protein